MLFSGFADAFRTGKVPLDGFFPLGRPLFAQVRGREVVFRDVSGFRRCFRVSLMFSATPTTLPPSWCPEWGTHEGIEVDVLVSRLT